VAAVAISFLLLLSLLLLLYFVAHFAVVWDVAAACYLIMILTYDTLG